MNLRKKITALITVLTVALSLLPAGMTAVQATGGDLFIEDFESYEVGVIAQNAGTYNYDPGTSFAAGIGYKLKAGDKIEIAEENGNKYLKITRGSTSTDFSRYTYFFPQIYESKKYTVSYDFMTEEHNQNFQRIFFVKEDDGIILHYNPRLYFQKEEEENIIYFDENEDFKNSLITESDNIEEENKENGNILQKNYFSIFENPSTKPVPDIECEDLHEITRSEDKINDEQKSKASVHRNSMGEDAASCRWLRFRDRLARHCIQDGSRVSRDRHLRVSSDRHVNNC